MGANEVEAAQIDAVCEHVRDIKDAYQKVRGIQGEVGLACPLHLTAFSKGLLKGPKRNIIKGPFKKAVSKERFKAF